MKIQLKSLTVQQSTLLESLIKKTKNMIIEILPKLYRYDLIEPPSTWDTNFHSPEVNYNDVIYGKKNQAGLFFFIDSEDEAKTLGQIASGKENKDKYFITELSDFKQPIKIIDFISNDSIYQMLCTLSDMGINVLTDKFKIYNKSHKENDFSSFNSVFQDAESAFKKKDQNTWWNLIDQLNIGTNSSHDTATFGQILTDFGNGIIFKSMIQHKYPDIDGYRWKENSKGITYCLFEKNKLQKKQTIIVDVQNSLQQLSSI